MIIFIYQFWPGVMLELRSLGGGAFDDTSISLVQRVFVADKAREVFYVGLIMLLREEML